MRKRVFMQHTRMLVVTDFMGEDSNDVLRFEEVILTHVIEKGVKKNNAFPTEDAMEKGIGLL